MEIKGVAEVEKKIMVHEREAYKKETWRVYTEGGYKDISSYEKKQYKKRINNNKLEYILVQIEDSYNGTLEDYYNEIVEDAIKLKKYSRGRINMFKTGSYARTAIKYLYDILNKGIKTKTETYNLFDNLQPIQDYEIRFLLHCGGALRIGRKYEGPLYKYDARSYYASIYTSCHLLVPIKAGILKTLTKDEFINMKYYDIGVYRCVVERPTDDRQYLVWINEGNYYTHYELNYFKELGLTYELLEEENNFLHYPRNYCLNGSQIFGEFGHEIYNYKCNQVPRAKKLLNTLWGILVRPNIDVKVYKKGELIEFDESDILPLERKNGDIEVKTLREKPFEFDLARLKPFFLAKCRLTMAKHIQPHVKDVYYCHTDSIISSKPLNFVDKGKLGNFKYEGMVEKGFVKNKVHRTNNKYFKL